MDDLASKNNQKYRILAPLDGFEPPTKTLTAFCSTTELQGNKLYLQLHTVITTILPRTTGAMSVLCACVSRVLTMYVGAYIALLTAYHRLTPKAKIFCLNC
jgi:hypothetical protein